MVSVFTFLTGTKRRSQANFCQNRRPMRTVRGVSTCHQRVSWKNIKVCVSCQDTPKLFSQQFWCERQLVPYSDWHNLSIYWFNTFFPFRIFYIHGIFYVPDSFLCCHLLEHLLSLCLLSCNLWVGNLVSYSEKKCKLRLIKSGTLRKIFGLKRAEVTWGWRKQSNEGLRHMYCVLNIVLVWPQ